MNRPRGRPARGQGVTRERILDAALGQLDEGASLSMRALAAQLGVTPISLYHHVADRAGLLRALADRVYGALLLEEGAQDGPAAAIRLLLTRYYEAVGRHPQLTLALFAEPEALGGAARELTDRLGALLATLTPAHRLWRDILIDHAHGSGLALGAARGDAAQAKLLREQYAQALDSLLAAAQN